MPLDVLVIGHLGTESVKTPFGEDFVLGGAAYYAAIGVVMSGASTGIVSCVGPDYPLDSLVAFGISIEGIHIINNEKTTHFNIIYQPTFNERKVDVILEAGKYIEAVNLPTNYLEARYVHISTNHPKHQLTLLEQLRNYSRNYTVSVDCFDQFVVEDPSTVSDLLNQVDFYFANEDEDNLLRHLPINKGIPHIVKRGALGAEYVSNEEIIRVTTTQSNLVDPTGAGDVFAGCFLGNLALNKNIKTSIANACMLASRKVEGFGIKGLL